MKKRVVFLFSIAILAGSLSSCKKCITCTYGWNDSNGISQSKEETFCGSRKELNTYRQNVEYVASTFQSEAECE